LRDFPAAQLKPYDLEAQHPDDFVLGILDLAPAAVARIVGQQAAALKNPPTSVTELLDTLRRQNLVRSVAKLRELFGE
jgi:hypothetical protein